MGPSRLEFDDPRAPRATAQIRGKTYSYIYAKAEGTAKANIFLVHGFPDLGWAWRHQVPFLQAAGYNVVVPDMLGYGGTDAPLPLEQYTLKELSHDIAALTAHVFGPGARIVLGGHDWGGFLVWRTALWYPELIIGTFSIATPFTAPSKRWIDMADVVAMGVKTLGYQLQFRGPDVEERIQGEAKIRQFLNGMLGGRGPNGEVAFTPEDGVQFQNLELVRPNLLVSQEDLNIYVREYMKNGMRGPLNWYRTRKLNYEDELLLVQEAETKGELKFAQPGMMILATKDTVLLPSMADGMERFFDSYTRKEVIAHHWAMLQAPDECNQIIQEWIEGVVLKEATGVKAAL